MIEASLFYVPRHIVAAREELFVLNLWKGLAKEKKLLILIQGIDQLSEAAKIPPIKFEYDSFQMF